MLVQSCSDEHDEETSEDADENRDSGGFLGRAAGPEAVV